MDFTECLSGGFIEGLIEDFIDGFIEGFIKGFIEGSDCSLRQGAGGTEFARNRSRTWFLRCL